MDERWMPTLAQRRRGVKTLDVVLFGAIVLFIAGLVVISTFFIRSWTAHKIVGLFALWASVMVVASIHYIKKWMSRPDFITKHGTAIWTNNLADITPRLMDRALCRFLDVMESEQSEVSRHELECMLARMGIEWEANRINMWVGRYEMKDKAGVQSGYRVWVHWAGNIAESALFHELLHAANETIRLPKLMPSLQTEFRMNDVRHMEADWWRLEGILVDDF